jgi:large subunit ribosomal protein L29
MKVHEIRQLSDAELQKRISDEKENLAHLNFQKATKQIENTAQIKASRRDIARMLTILGERVSKATTPTS